jgi:hypothetical protein
MPRTSKLKRNHRNPTSYSDQATFDYSRPGAKIAAKPVDAYERPAHQQVDKNVKPVRVGGAQIHGRPGGPPIFIGGRGQSNEAAQLMDVLDSMNAAVSIYHKRKKEKEAEAEAKAAEYDKRQAKLDAKQGMIDAFKGDDLMMAYSEAYKRAYLGVQGILAAPDIDAAMVEYDEANRDADPEEWGKGMLDILKESMKDKTTDEEAAIMEELMPKLQKYRQNHMARLHKKKQEETGLKFRKYIAMKAGEMYSDFKMRAQEKGMDDPRYLAVGMRQLLTELQGNADLLKLYDPAQIKEQAGMWMVDTLGPMAARKGQPDLLGFIWEPDEHGIALTQTKNGQKATRYYDQAVAERNSQQAKAQKLQKEQMTEVKLDLSRQIAKMVYSDDPETQGAGFQLFEKAYTMLPPSEVKAYEKAKRAYETGQGFAPQESAMTIRASNQAIAAIIEHGPLNQEHLNYLMPQMTMSEWKKVNERNTKALADQVKEAKGEGSSFEKRFGGHITRRRRAGASLAGHMTADEKFDDPKFGPLRKDLYLRLFDETMESWYAANPDKKPTMKELDEWDQQAVREAFDQYPSTIPALTQRLNGYTGGDYKAPNEQDQRINRLRDLPDY